MAKSHMAIEVLVLKNKTCRCLPSFSVLPPRNWPTEEGLGSWHGDGNPLVWELDRQNLHPESWLPTTLADTQRVSSDSFPVARGSLGHLSACSSVSQSAPLLSPGREVWMPQCSQHGLARLGLRMCRSVCLSLSFPPSLSRTASPSQFSLYRSDFAETLVNSHALCPLALTSVLLCKRSCDSLRG